MNAMLKTTTLMLMIAAAAGLAHARPLPAAATNADLFEYAAVDAAGPADWRSGKCLDAGVQQSPVNLRDQLLRPYNGTANNNDDDDDDEGIQVDALLRLNEAWLEDDAYKGVQLQLGRFQVELGPWPTTNDTEAAPRTWFNGTWFDLLQVHFHTPSGMSFIFTICVQDLIVMHASYRALC